MHMGVQICSPIFPSLALLRMPLNSSSGAPAMVSVKPAEYPLESGPGGALALSVLQSLSRALGLKKAYDAVRKSLNESALEIDISRAPSAARDEQLLLAIHDFILNVRVKRD